MATARMLVYWGDETDPASDAPAAVASTASSGSAPTNGPQIRFRSRDFNKDTDKTFMVWIKLPGDYNSGGTMVVDWLTTVTSGNVVLKHAFVVCHPASEGSPTDIDAASLGTVTAESAVAVPATAGSFKEQTLTLGITGAHPGDRVCVMVGRDADHASDTAAADIKFLEPALFTYSTTAS